MKKSDPYFFPAARRLHPVSVIFFIGKAVKDLLYPFMALILTTIFRGSIHWLWLTGIVILFVSLLLIISVLTWYRFVYFIDRNAVRIEHGVLVRKKLWIVKERVQSIDSSSGIFGRAFGLVKLQIETAGGKKPEVVLNAITASDAERIRASLSGPAVPSDELNASGQPNQTSGLLQTSDETPVRIIRLPLRDLLIYSATSGRIGVVIAIIGAVYSQFDDWLERTFDVWGLLFYWLGSAQIGWLLLLLLFLAWLAALIITAVKEYGFTLKLMNDRLVVERGLLERKQVTLPLNRIQAVHLISNAVRRQFGMVSVHIVTAGYAGKQGQSALLFPLVRYKDLAPFLSSFTPQIHPVSSWNRLEKRALVSYLALPAILSIIAVIPSLLWIPHPYGYFALLLLPGAVLWSWLRFKETGWNTENGQMSIRYGSFAVHQAFIPKRRIQWNRLTQTPMQEGKQLATLHVALASGTAAALFRIRHLPARSGLELKHWITSS